MNRPPQHGLRLRHALATRAGWHTATTATTATGTPSAVASCDGWDAPRRCSRTEHSRTEHTRTGHVTGRTHSVTGSRTSRAKMWGFAQMGQMGTTTR
eukprot:6524017-Pyramimonas_sp.AAC.1